MIAAAISLRVACHWWTRSSAFRRWPASVERDPAHQLRVLEVAGLAPGSPRSRGLSPASGRLRCRHTRRAGAGSTRRYRCAPACCPANRRGGRVRGRLDQAHHASAVSSSRSWISVCVQRRGRSSDVVRCCSANDCTSPDRTGKRAWAVITSISRGNGDDSASTSAPPRALTPPSTSSSTGETSPYSGRGAYTSSRSNDPRRRPPGAAP